MKEKLYLLCSLIDLDSLTKFNRGNVQQVDSKRPEAPDNGIVVMSLLQQQFQLRPGIVVL